MNLFSRIGLPAAVGAAPVFVNKTCKIPQPKGLKKENTNNPQTEGPCRKKNRNHFQPEGRQAKLADRPADYEAASGPRDIQRLPSSFPDKNRLDKTGGAGVSPARFCLLFPRGKSRPPEAYRQAKEKRAIPQQAAPPKKRNAPQPEGRQAKCGRAPHRLRGSQRPKGHSAAAQQLP